MDLVLALPLYVVLGLVFFLALHFLTTGKQSNKANLPPGPPCLPIIGNLLALGDKPHKSLAKLAMIHGPLMSLEIGQVTTVVISSASVAKEILQKHDSIFSNRTIPNAARALDHHEFSMVWLSVTPAWRNLRKVCNSYIFTSQKLDDNKELRHKIVQELLADVQEHCLAGESVDIGQAAFRTTFNALSNIVFSLDLRDSSSETVQKFKEEVRGALDELGRPNLADYFPILRYIDLQGIRRRTGFHFRKIFELFDQIINERLQARNMEGYIPANDMLDTLLSISEDNSGTMNNNYIKHLLLDVFGAGTDTISSTMEWAMAELHGNSRTLRRAREELDQTIGRGNILQESDIAHLPYLQAIFKETFRLHPPAPFLLPRKAGVGVEICGHTIPNGAQVLVNAWATGREPRIWDDPDSFVPERFLRSNIDVKGHNFELIPFGAGRRIFPGLPLAMRMLPLMFGSLIHSFGWQLEDGVTPENIDMEDRFVWRNLRKVCNSYLFTSQKLDANQELRQQKVQELVADIQEHCLAEKAVEIGQAAFKPTFNALSNTLLPLDLSDSSSGTAQKFKRVVRGIMDEIGKPNLSDYFPILQYIDLQGVKRRNVIHFRKIFDLFDHIINEKLQARNVKGYLPTNDMLDTLLSISQGNNDLMNNNYIKHLLLDPINDYVLECQDLFAAGTDTTSSTMEWAMAELLRNPRTMRKAREELDQTIGSGNMVEESDTGRLPYLQAIIKETLRLHPAAPLLLPRKQERNAWAIGRDPSIWEEPDSFVPERFLGSNIDFKGQNFELIPFGAGRRICPGLPLATRMLHLMLGSLLHSFDWQLEDGAIHFLTTKNEKNKAKLPPGPVPSPIIGNLLDLGDKPHKSLAKLAKIHGPLMSLNIGQVTTIVISFATLAKEILQKHDSIFSSRTIPDAVRALDHHEFGIAWLPVASAWRNLRKVCNSYIFTTQKLDANQELRRKKVLELVVDVQEHCLAGKAVDVSQAAFRTTFNALSNTVLSLDLSDSSSDTAQRFKEVVRGIMDEAGKPNLADYFPIFQYIDLQGIKRRTAIHFRKIFGLFDHIINERMQARNEEGYLPSNDMLDTLLSISKESGDLMNDNYIKHLLLDLFAAGTDTTSSTMEWAMAELLGNPRTLRKAREELEQTIGRGNMVQESDIARLPYLQAIIMETLRLHPAVPLLLPRKAGEICGFTIAKGAQETEFYLFVCIACDVIHFDNRGPFLQKYKQDFLHRVSDKLQRRGGYMDLVLAIPLSIVLGLVLFQALHFLTRRKQTNKAKLPPGPACLPVVGNLLDLGDKPHKSLAKLAKIHGPLMSLKLGQVTTVVISSATVAKEIFQKHDSVISNRAVIDATRALDEHKFGIVWLPVGPEWRNLRKICNTHVFTTQKLDANQEPRRKKVQELLADVQEHCLAGKAIDIGQAAFQTIFNSLSNSIFSLDLIDSSSGTSHKEVVRCIMDELGKPNLADYFPVFQCVDLQGIRRRSGIYFQKMFDLFDRIIKERLQSRKMEGYVPKNDMLETLLSFSEENSDMMDNNWIKHTFLDLFAAGTDTTTSTIEWAMAELLRNPRTLRRAREELEQTIGRGNLLQESDTAKLPYLHAIIKETFRLHPAAPLLVPREAGEEVEIHGFTIPKGARVMFNAWAIGRDGGIWDDPDSFVPERFLGSNIDFKGQNFELIPFGAGRRICLGLPLAIRTLHLILGSLIHSFEWQLEDGVTPENMDMEDRFGLTLEKAQPLRAIPIQPFS
ncbi:hypothetical protein Tsubulata_028109 [Turnera subulata]|uniref:Cytochrome P450 n=1 Tax=Turnera subulata TaxID=218843 RepID=A0A9Q0J3Q9_9ROSI|nr:hypothetical protein Tsubulata_028109 [Turnera subulata]